LSNATIQFDTARVARDATRCTLWLAGGHVTLDAHNAVRADIEIRDGRIHQLVFGEGTANHCPRSGSGAQSLMIDLSGYLILPGLINTHDHLEFNLFPRLGNGPYQNFQDWARDIYHPDRHPIRENLAVPKTVRLWWGGLKNLLCGVTTVCHHNPYVEEIFDHNFPVRVVKKMGWSHSLSLDKSLREAFLSTPPEVPFVIHLAEGKDEVSENELFTLDQSGSLDSRTVIIHGVGLNSAGHALLRRRGAALVWCPTSNMFTLGQTLDASTVSSTPRIALGNDSALTAQGDLLDEVCFVTKEFGLSSELVYSMITNRAADVLRLHDGAGSICPGGMADLIAIENQGEAPATSLATANAADVQFVLASGRPHLVSPLLAPRCPAELLADLESLNVQGIERLVRAPVTRLIKEAQTHLGSNFCLGGKRVVE
jgi:cytosine/adenosine deaminase-related metal-dependent hydrolase